MVACFGTGEFAPLLDVELARATPAHFDDLAAQILVEPYTYLAAVPGKEVRSALVDAFNLWLNVPEADLNVVKKLVGMLHTASLL